MRSLLIEQVEPHVIEHLSSKLMEARSLDSDVQLLQELTSHETGRSHIEWNAFVHHLLSVVYEPHFHKESITHAIV